MAAALVSAAAALSRSAWVGNSPLTLAAVTTTSPAIDRVQTAMRTRSRRKMSRASWAVPVSSLMSVPCGDAGALGLVGELVAVVAEEQLFERGRLAAEAAHAELGQVAQRRVEVVGVDVEVGPGILDVQVVDAHQLVQADRRVERLGRDRRE